MHILLVATSFGSLTQRVFAELGEGGHKVAVELAGVDDSLRAAVDRHLPDLIIAPMLKTAIPPDICSGYTCLIVHPGPVGDRGPSSLDWAIREGVSRWGVTVLQAAAELDAGDVWATVPCSMPPVGKSDLYRNEVSDAALRAVHLAVERFASGTYVPRPQNDPDPRSAIRPRPYLRQAVRRIDWEADPTDTVLRKLRAADSQPGVLDEFLGADWYLHGGHPEDRLHGRPGHLLATRAGAICRATVDSAVWIPQMRPRHRDGRPAFTLPATLALGERLPPSPDDPAPLDLSDSRPTWSDIGYREDGPVGFLRFAFAGGAMSTSQCRRLLQAYRMACSRPTSLLVLGGGRDFFSNGIHLNVIEAAADPAAESWANIIAMDDLVEAVLTTTDRLVVAALGGNAAAGGVMLALAADEVWCRRGAVFNPHYRLMGLYGSEYWTYTLPRRLGASAAEELTRRALPVSSEAAARIGLVDRILGCAPGDFGDEVAHLASHLATTASARARIAAKKARLEGDQAAKPLSAYRHEELARMHRIFFNPEHAYHALRRAFVRKERPAGSPGRGPAPPLH